MLRDKLGIRCPASSLLTNELEAEVFLHLLQSHADAVDAVGPAPAAAAKVADVGDGSAGARRAGGDPAAPGLLQRLLAPLRLGGEDVAPALAKLGSALAVTNVGRSMLQQLGGRLVARHVQYEAALHLALHAGAKGVQGRVAVQVRGCEGKSRRVGRVCSVALWVASSNCGPPAAAQCG